MESMKPIHCLIYRPHKARYSDILRLLCSRTPKDSRFVDHPTQAAPFVYDTKLTEFHGAFMVGLGLFIQKLLIAFRTPLRWFGLALEFLLNFFDQNGSFIGVLKNIFQGAVVIPHRESSEFRTFIGFLDQRVDLYGGRNSHRLILDEMLTKVGVGHEHLVDLCMLASKIAYENASFIEKVVTKHWDMHFIGLFNCWDEYRRTKCTQAYIFTEKPKNAKLIVVAFRGTEPFDVDDWCTDLDLSFASMGAIGRAHIGFLKALGLRDEYDLEKGWPKNDERSDKNEHPYAYYTIREKLKELLKDNPNAKFIITGHSLGGALAVLFTTLLLMHEENELMSKLMGIFTFGQPRVGDGNLSSFMERNLNQLSKRYYRMVYRYDLVPRIPFDDPISKFKHCGLCLYYRGWYKGDLIGDQPNKNYFDLNYFLPHYYNSWADLLQSRRLGEDYKESQTSTMCRMFGLLIPGIASHSPKDYVNSARLATLADAKLY
ncbi:hypothetical protein AMTRI_Chr09g18790 [Amborella trichopoda]